LELKKKNIIVNTEIDNVRFGEAVSVIKQWALERNRTRYVVTPNVDHIVRLQSNVELQEIYRKADLVLADGMPLLWAGKLLGTPFYDKISGSDLFVKVCQAAAQNSIKLFFLGGNPGDAEKAKNVLSRQNPGIQIEGIYSPPFGFEKDHQENNKIVDMIKHAKPDILFVGLGFPKQEKWIYNHYQALGVPVCIGVGVSFSFVVGSIKRAPLFMQKTGLEWFWRLMMEPRRLWKRYLVDDMKFFWLVLKQKLL